MSQHSHGSTSTSMDTKSGFVFYDPFYEELLRRKKDRELFRDVKMVPLNTWSSFDSPIKDCSISSDASSVSDSLSKSPEKPVPIRRNEVLEPREPFSVNSKTDIEQLERAMRALYADIDRQKLMLTESMDREARAAKELLNLRKKLKSENPSRFVSSEEYKDLETKYINALKLVDDLNWRLNSLPPGTT